MSIYTIYRATNTINGKVYIGFDSNWPDRLQSHKYKSKKCDYKFHRAIKKYGWDNFVWDVIYQSMDYEYTLETMEPYFICEYNSVNNGYNILSGGKSWAGSKNPMKNPDIVSKMSGTNHYTRKDGFIETRKGKNHYNFDHQKYIWKNIDTGEICHLTRYEFRMRTGATESSLSFYINGQRGKQVKGWVIIPPED